MKQLIRVVLLLLCVLFPLQQSEAKKVVPGSEVTVCELRVEQLVNPMGIDTPVPRLGWKLKSEKQDVMQTAYRILVASDAALLAEGKADLWDSGLVESDSSVWVSYRGRELKTGQRCFWKVQVSTTVGQTAWSEPAMWSMGLLEGETAWRGRWIGWDAPMEGDVESMSSRLCARYFRKEFRLKKPLRRATMYVMGLGLYEAYVCGKELGGTQVLVPAPTDYRRTVFYNTYDVTEELSGREEAAVGIVLGNGRFYTMCQNYKTYKIHNFGYPKLRMNLVVEYADGSKETIVSDESWKVTGKGPIRSNNEYDGEEYDANYELGDWTTCGYDDSAWAAAWRVGIPTGTPRAMMMPAMQVVDSMKPVCISRKDGKLILDMGLNMTGWLRMKVRGGQGDTIRLRFAERLDEDGTLYTANLRDARQTDTYICNGKEQGRSWRPTFVTHGFRYVEVEGAPDACPEDFMGEFVCDEMPVNGTFSCSSDVLNKVYQAAFWGIRGNYKGMPVDCPQRNERMPWLGDRTRGALGESYIFGNERLYAKWMDDIREAQREDGCIPDVAPAYWYYYTDDVTWPAAFLLVCDMLYTQYGNIRPIAKNYPAMKRWMLHMRERWSNREGLITRDKYGDWCLPPEKLNLIHSQDPSRKTDGMLIASAYYIKMLQVMTHFAGLLGQKADADMWTRWEQEMKAAFNKRFLRVKKGTSPRPEHYLYPDSIFYDNNTATANLLPLAFDIVPEEYRMEVTRNMVARMTLPEKGFTMPRKAFIKSGVIGISWLMTELTRCGRGDVAYALATQDEYPSWGYMVRQGATTIWELWNGDKADPAMNSGNHVMLLGDLITWCYAHAGGISSSRSADGVGYKRIVLRPDFSVPDLDHVDCAYETPYGKVVSRWKKSLMQLDWEIEIPCNTRAEVCLPDGTVKELGSGKYTFKIPLESRHPGVLEESYLYTYASFPQCHSATIEENSEGDLVAAFFGGTKERHPDVCIYVCRKRRGETVWSEPELVADGVFNEVNRAAYSEKDVADGVERKACWNPVLYQVPGGDLLLFYKIGSSVADWTGWLVRSKDGGSTWGRPEALPEGFLGPIKNKPVMVDGRLISPSSTEEGGWKLHFELSDDGGKTWRMVGPIPAEMALRTQYIRPDGLAGDSTKLEPLVTIQPTILKLADGRLQALARTRNGFMAVTYSEDKGETWSRVKLMKNLPQNNSGVDAVTLADGRHWLIYNHLYTVPGTEKGWRTPLDIAQSADGSEWQHILCLEDAPIGQYSYPSIIQDRDGMIHVIYTWRRERVKYMKIDPDRFSLAE